MDIRDFQKSEGLVPDGVVGKKTVQAFKRVYNWTNEQVSHFLGQTHIESRGFRDTTENMNYSASRLAQVWPQRYALNPQSTHKIPNELAKRLSGDPEAIANNVYANRMGNGSEETGDGWKHRGRGYIQLTGKTQHYDFADYVGDPDIKRSPAKIAEKYQIESAIYYFEKNKLFRGLLNVDYATIKRLTKAVNGGFHGLKERKEQTEKYYRLAIQS